MTCKLAWPLLLAAALIAPGAMAATTISGPAETIQIPYDGSGSIDIDVTVDCIDFVTAPATTIEGTLSVSGADWLTSDGAGYSFGGADCIAALAAQMAAPTLTQTVTLSLTPDATAPGMTPTQITVSDADGNTGTATVEVSYKKGYTFTVDEDFPLEVGHDVVSFQAMLHLTSNARTMAMWQILNGTDFVSVSGIPEFKTYQDTDLAGDLEVMAPLTITVTPPETGSWESDTLEFRTWSHFLDNGTMMTDEMVYTWTFTNAHPSSGSGEKKDSPGIDTVVLSIGLLAAAFVALRRRG